MNRKLREEHAEFIESLIESQEDANETFWYYVNNVLDPEYSSDSDFAQYVIGYIWGREGLERLDQILENKERQLEPV